MYLQNNFNIPSICAGIHYCVVVDSVSVALQFPEGLLLFACIIVDILERFPFSFSLFTAKRQSLSVIVLNPCVFSFCVTFLCICTHSQIVHIVCTNAFAVIVVHML